MIFRVVLLIYTQSRYLTFIYTTILYLRKKLIIILLVSHIYTHTYTYYIILYSEQYENKK